MFNIHFPQIDKIYYLENNSTWFKNGEMKVFAPENFCNIESQSLGMLHTVDLAMLTTIPRMYDFTENGKCFIKPSMRGLFNSTMKYILGKYYENDEIEIYCMKLTKDPVLVITSGQILNKTLKIWSNDNITIIDKKNVIKNKDYFENFSTEHLNDESKYLMKIYDQCVLKFGPGNCENEWTISKISLFHIFHI